jgi:hypothetical protein
VVAFSVCFLVARKSRGSGQELLLPRVGTNNPMFLHDLFLGTIYLWLIFVLLVRIKLIDLLVKEVSPFHSGALMVFFIRKQKNHFYN